MIEYGPTRHTLRARTLTAAFARVRAFVDGHTEFLRATSGFGGDEIATLGAIAEVLAELDESDPMAGLNGYAWTIEVALRSRPGQAPSDDSADALVQEAVHATMGIRLVAAKRGQQAHRARRGHRTAR